MKRLSLAVLVFLLAGLLALGTLVAFARGSVVGGTRGAVSALHQDDDHPHGDVANQNGENENDDADNADAQNQGEVGQGAQEIAAAIGQAFGVDSAAVMALHDEGIGWGALFQLYAIAKARNMTVDQLLTEIGFTADGEHHFAFGKLKQSLSEQEAAALESGPKNLGQLISGAHQGGAEGQSAGHGFGRGHGTGKPAGVPPSD